MGFGDTVYSGLQERTISSFAIQPGRINGSQPKLTFAIVRPRMACLTYLCCTLHGDMPAMSGAGPDKAERPQNEATPPNWRRRSAVIPTWQAPTVASTRLEMAHRHENPIGSGQNNRMKTPEEQKPKACNQNGKQPPKMPAEATKKARHTAPAKPNELNKDFKTGGRITPASSGNAASACVSVMQRLPKARPWGPPTRIDTTARAPTTRADSP